MPRGLLVEKKDVSPILGSACSDRCQFNNEMIEHIRDFVCVCVFLGLHSWHMEIPRPGVHSELQQPAHTTATAIQDLSHVCNLHTPQLTAMPDSQPTEKARDQTRVLVDTSQIRFH